MVVPVSVGEEISALNNKMFGLNINGVFDNGFIKHFDDRLKSGQHAVASISYFPYGNAESYFLTTQVIYGEIIVYLRNNDGSHLISGNISIDVIVFEV